MSKPQEPPAASSSHSTISDTASDDQDVIILDDTPSSDTSDKPANNATLSPSVKPKVRYYFTGLEFTDFPLFRDK